MPRLIHPIRDNSLSIVLFTLFILCLLGQSFAGWWLQNQTLEAHGKSPIGYWQNLSSGTFLEGLASNWQAAFLQLASLVAFSGLLYQRGAAHSRDPDKPKGERESRRLAARFHWIYRNSLFLALFVLTIVSFALHAVFGRDAYNEDRMLTGHEPVSFSVYLTSAKFWASNLQTWQAEYLAIALFVIFSIYFRQQDSAESKPVDASDRSDRKGEQLTNPGLPGGAAHGFGRRPGDFLSGS